MGGQSCECCKSWVDDIYWSHFQCFRFAQFLRSGFEQRLAIPKTFSDNLKKKLPENVGLKGPGGIVWNVGLTTRDDILYFKEGWSQFVKDHCLKENDFLVFKYNCGESLIDVLMFDGESFCEKAASYFVRKCGHTEQGGGCSSKGKTTGSFVEEEVHTPSNAGVKGAAAPEKSVHDNRVRVPTALPFESPSERTFNAGVESASPAQFMEANGDMVPKAVPFRTTDKRIKKLVSAVKHVQTKRRGRPPKVSSATKGVVDWVTDTEPASEPASEPTSVDKSTGYMELYTSNRRPVTEDEINKALSLAQAACKEHSLLIVMRPTHVYKRFYLAIPTKWITEHLPPRSQELILRMAKTEWHVKYSYHRTGFTGGLTGGWRKFALDNNLEEFDVCVFEPNGKINDTMIMDVNIFRVVEEIAPLTMVNSPGKRGRKRAIKDIET